MDRIARREMADMREQEISRDLRVRRSVREMGGTRSSAGRLWTVRNPTRGTLWVLHRG